ncbi:hypothetical protein LEP1GSC151_5671 [Leptospira interrogans serovar Grippotyphosa str. LT2186]|uniref:Uncharacterized protein n=1 Tax=Leptospira interrogans serovar Grippotyphosa str. LT2186 TaxID=1001599 RepID=M3H688_LEPIR|nr:hypothetical protein LEP1GSC151_5671 [Leptospira interrogans serovar Grippotyphosa str. LT2186]
MQITTSKIRFNFKTLIFLYITRNRNYKVSQFTFRVMRNHLFNYIILCILVPSILFSSPVEDFLNPEKKEKLQLLLKIRFLKKILRKKNT